MNIDQMFQMQEILDKRIETEHGLLKADLFDQKLLALQVEIGELANETRCFKFWSEKPASPKETILEEFVDGVHFILSLGIVLSFNKEIREPSMTNKAAEDLTEMFLAVYEMTSKLRKTRTEDDYWELFSAFLRLGELLGFSNEDIYRAYIEKNAVNHKRQDEGY